MDEAEGKEQSDMGTNRGEHKGDERYVTISGGMEATKWEQNETKNK